MDDEHAGREGDEDARPTQPARRPLGKLRGWKKWLRLPLAVIFTIGGVASLVDAYLQVRDGRGGELHRSLWGHTVSPIGVLVGVAVAAVAFVSISLAGWLLERRDRAPARKRRRE